MSIKDRNASTACASLMANLRSATVQKYMVSVKEATEIQSTTTIGTKLLKTISYHGSVSTLTPLYQSQRSTMRMSVLEFSHPT